MREALDPAQRVERDQVIRSGPARPVLGVAAQVEPARFVGVPLAPQPQQRVAVRVPDAHARDRRERDRLTVGGDDWGRQLAIHDLPLPLRRQPAQLPVEHHLEHFAPAVGVDLHDQAIAELRMAKPLADLVARHDQFHSGNSSPRRGTRTSDGKRARSRSASVSAGPASPCTR